MRSFEERLSRGAWKAAPALCLAMAGMQSMALNSPGSQGGTAEGADIPEINDLVGIGNSLILYIQVGIVSVAVLVFIINAAMEAGKERPDLAGILQKLTWAAAISGTSLLVVDFIAAVWGAGINPAMIIQ